MRLKVFVISLGAWLLILVTCAFMVMAGDGWFAYVPLDPGHVPASEYIAGLLMSIAAGLLLFLGPPALVATLWRRRS